MLEPLHSLWHEIYTTQRKFYIVLRFFEGTNGQEYLQYFQRIISWKNGKIERAVDVAERAEISSFSQ